MIGHTLTSGDRRGRARQLLDEVRERLAALARRRFVATGGAGAAAIWLAAWVLQRFAPAAAPAVVIAVALAVGATAVLILYLLWSRRRLPDDPALARFVEESCPSLEDRLVTAVEAMRNPGPSGLTPALLADADRAVSTLSVDDVVPPASLRRATIHAAGTLALCAATAFMWLEPGHRALQITALWLMPGHFALNVSPGDVRVQPEQRLTIRAHASGPFGPLSPRLEVSVGGSQTSVAMREETSADFSWTFDRVPASFTYRVTAAGRASEAYRVTLLERPRVRRIDVHYTFPAYTRLAPRSEEDGGDIFAPAGSRVRLVVHSTKPLRASTLAMSDGRRVALRAGPTNTAQGEITISADGAYRVVLGDADGLTSNADTEYFIRVLDDRPPNVRILRPASDRRVTPLEEVTIEARADDDYGISAFDLVYAVRGEAERALPLADVARRLPSATGRRTLYLEDLGVQPGDFVTYYARARDIGRGKASAEARTDIFFLEVTPFEEEFAAAQTQAGAGGGGDQSVDDLVTAQKNIIVATWKLERRAAAGQSKADVLAVGRAQGELKARAARVAQRPSGPGLRRRGPSIGVALDRSAGDAAITKAVAAMERAETSLLAKNTRAAIPSEMEALNHLLRAQAEIRRREVMRQQAFGGGGANRADQDLSSLFDRELRRQQQTNYETPRTTEERKGEQDDELLQRIRELARRQEQLARRQEELSRDRDRLPREELRRRLEQLAREQSELRRQTEQTAQQSATSPSRGEQQPSSGGTASQLRDASEQMRQAANELRSEDADRARERGRQALDRLRSLERSMEGGQPDDQRRALGDLQLEARQLAERQRQLARQAEEIGKGGETSSDERRRLAGEQDRTADRAERLGERLGELASTGQGQSREASRAAERAVKEQQLVRRMRDAARALRESPAKDKGAAATADISKRAQELSRDLDTVAERLEPDGAPQDAERQRIADSLAAATRLREELGGLQQQMAELQQRSGEPASPSQAQNGSSSPQATGGESGTEQLERLRDEYARRTREIARLERSAQADARGDGMSTPEGQETSLSAPGTEAFKQDFSGWERLHRDVTLRLERIEASLSQRLLERAGRERLQSGSADSTLDRYEQAVDRYFQSIADGEESPR
jgi:hypothetical protein